VSQWVRGASARQIDDARWILDEFLVKVDCFSNDLDTPTERPVTEEELRVAARRVVSGLGQAATGSTFHPSRLGIGRAPRALIDRPGASGCALPDVRHLASVALAGRPGHIDQPQGLNLSVLTLGSFRNARACGCGDASIA
jgi:hypothetical protein